MGTISGTGNTNKNNILSRGLMSKCMNQWVKREVRELIKTECCSVTLCFKFFFSWLYVGFSFQCLYLYSKKNLRRPKVVRNVQINVTYYLWICLFYGQAEHISCPHDLLTQAASGCTELP